MPEPLDLNDIRDRPRRARATEEPYDAADQWAALGADVPALLEEVARLRAEVDRYRELQDSLWPVISAAHAMRALYAPEIGPQNESLFRPHELALIRAVDSSTVGSVWVDGRLAEVACGVWAERDAALKVVHAAESWRDAGGADRDGPTAVDTATHVVVDLASELAGAVDEWRASR